MNTLERRLAVAAVLTVSIGLAVTNAFEKNHDPLRKLRLEHISPANPTDIVQVGIGSDLYAANCAACHGGTLEGAENWQDGNEDGTYDPPPHDDSGHTWHHSDKVLFEYTKLGGEELFKDSPDIVSAMPGFGDTLSDDEIWSVLAFIKASWSKEMQASQTMASQHDPLPDEHRTGEPG